LRRAIAHTRTYLSDCLTPVRVYSRLATRSPVGFLLESVTGGEQVSRFSFLGAGPRELLRVYPDRCERIRLDRCGDGDGAAEAEAEAETLPGPPLEALAEAVGAIAAEPGPLPFTGGWVGYFGYDLARLIERLPDRPPDPFELPAAALARFDDVIVFDHAHQRVIAVANEIEGEVSAADAEDSLARLEELLTAAGGEGGVAVPAEALEAPAGIRCGLPGDAFRRGVATIREEIAAGEIFQAVLARRWTVPRRVPPLALYRALRLINPSPYMVLLELPEVALAGASPEMLVRTAGGRLATRPIAGTRPRGDCPEADLRLAADLAADPKERAEHVMLVDLGRNDLGRVALPGSVAVASFMEVERYSHVMHMVSSVEADLAPGKTALDALLACFPAGTVSGAPKIRAMEILDRLEPEARGPYAGAVGYLSFTGDLDTCITIRTLVVRGEETSVTAGAGIVADSDPAREEEETENKAAALLAAVALAEELSR
jgi:anthranilate synthase component 1